jgi:hypothetical protein
MYRGHMTLTLLTPVNCYVCMFDSYLPTLVYSVFLITSLSFSLLLQTFLTEKSHIVNECKIYLEEPRKRILINQYGNGSSKAQRCSFSFLTGIDGR